MTQKMVRFLHTDVLQFIICLPGKETTTMRMKSALTHALMLPLVLFGALAAAPKVSVAAWTDHHGAVCKNHYARDVSYIDYTSNGIMSFKTVPTVVICPLSRNTNSSNGAYFYINVTHYGTETTSCTAVSVRNDATLLAYASKSWTGSGNGLLEINLYGHGTHSDALSNYSVLCSIPGNRSGDLRAVNFFEY
jgi:hypothetical protein